MAAILFHVRSPCFDPGHNELLFFLFFFVFFSRVEEKNIEISNAELAVDLQLRVDGETKEGMSERVGTTNGRDNTRSQKSGFRGQNKSSMKRQSMPVKTDRRSEVEEKEMERPGPGWVEEEREEWTSVG